jgi:glycosyltransferase involved in cell wall biosynthesis
MRILYFSFVELDIPNACSSHTLGVINGFANHDCVVDALVPRPLKKPVYHHNIKMRYLWPWRFTRLGKIWIKLLSLIEMFWLCLNNKYDFIYVREMELNPGPRWCSTIFRIPLYIEINEVLVPYFKNIGSSKIFVKAVERNQRKDMEKCDGIIINSLPMGNWLMHHYRIRNDKVHHVLNGAEVPRDAPLKKKEARQLLNMPAESFCLGFLGNLYDRYDFETLLKSATICLKRIPNISLLFIGDGPSKNELEKNFKNAGFGERIFFTGYIKNDLLGSYLPAMDIGLCLFNKKLGSLYGSISTKIASYGIHGIPTIVSSSSLLKYQKMLINKLFIVEPENEIALAALVEKLYSKPVELKQAGENFRKYALNRMTWDDSAKMIIKAYWELREQRGRKANSNPLASKLDSTYNQF